MHLHNVVVPIELQYRHAIQTLESGLWLEHTHCVAAAVLGSQSGDTLAAKLGSWPWDVRSGTVGGGWDLFWPKTVPCQPFHGGGAGAGGFRIGDFTRNGTERRT